MNLFNYIKDELDATPQRSDRVLLWLAYAQLITLTLLVIGVVIFFPLAVIWALNVLFKSGIEYNFTTWLAVVVLYGIFRGEYIPLKNRREKIQKTKL